MLELVILDMDGTLLDTERYSVDAWQAAGRDMGFDLPEEFLVSFFGMDRESIDALFLNRYGTDFPITRARALKLDYMRGYISRGGIPVKPGATELLKRLRELGLKTGLATGTEREIAERQLADAGLLEYLDYRLCGSMVQRSKPAPDIVLGVLELAGCHPEHALVVEDSDNGARAAIAAGVKAVIVPDIREPAEELRPLVCRVCPTLFEVMELVEELRR